MSHRRIKNVDYDADSDGGYSDDAYGAPPDAELSPSERADLKSAVARTRAALGPVASAAVSDRDARDAVWEAYYDAVAAAAELKALPKVKQALSKAAVSLALGEPQTDSNGRIIAPGSKGSQDQQPVLEHASQTAEHVPEPPDSPSKKPLSALQRRKLDLQKKNGTQQPQGQGPPSKIPSSLDRLIGIQQRRDSSTTVNSEDSLGHPPSFAPPDRTGPDQEAKSPPRTSKLAALAAARRKAREENVGLSVPNGASPRVSPTLSNSIPNLPSNHIGKTIALLDRLGCSSKSTSPTIRTATPILSSRTSPRKAYASVGTKIAERISKVLPQPETPRTPPEEIESSKRMLGFWSLVDSWKYPAFALPATSNRLPDMPGCCLSPSPFSTSAVGPPIVSRRADGQFHYKSTMIPYFNVFSAIPGAQDLFLGPSPDDIVIMAQAGAAKMSSIKTPGKPAEKPKSQTSISLLKTGSLAKSKQQTKRKQGGSTAKTREKAATKNATAQKNPLGKAALQNAVEGISALGIRGKPSSKSQGSGTSTPRSVLATRINVVAEWKKKGPDSRKDSSFVVIGHVDHGKSTLMGQLLYSLSLVSKTAMRNVQKTADQHNKSSFVYAYLMDSNPDEQERGVTVDISTRHFETEKTGFTILDAPGHQDFVPNMIAGVAQADFAVLTIDARVDGFEAGLRGQTQEHAVIARNASGNSAMIIVAVNKMDAAGWSEDRYTEICDQMSGFLGKLGYTPDRVLFVPCAGLTGENVVKPVSKNQSPGRMGEPSADCDCDWYTGPTLIQALDRAATATFPTEEVVKKPLWFEAYDIRRSSHDDGPVLASASVTIGGRVISGSVQAGEELVVAGKPDLRPVVKLVQGSISGDAAENREWAVAGSHIRLHLTNVQLDELQQGDIFTSTHEPAELQLRSKVRARILALDTLTPGPVEVFVGVRNMDATVSRLFGIVDLRAERQASLAKKDLPDAAGASPAAATPIYSRRNPKIVPSGSMAALQFDIVDPGTAGGAASLDDESTGEGAPKNAATTGVVVTAGRRVVIRREGRTIGIGKME